MGSLLCCPLRGLFQSPKKLLCPHVREGMTVLEPGCGMGWFSLPLARIVGPSGKVVCADVQPEMLEGLRRRALRAGLLDRIEVVVCSPSDLGVGAWEGRVDLAVALLMLHEVPDVEGFLRQVHAALRPGGALLVVEPRGHVSREDFEASLAAAARAGFLAEDSTARRPRLSALLRKTGG